MEAKILELLQAGDKANAELRAALGIAYEEYYKHPRSEAAVEFDRTLKKMKKAGTIKTTQNRWFVGTRVTCAECGGRGYKES